MKHNNEFKNIDIKKLSLEVIHQGIKKAGSISELSRHIGVKSSTIASWIRPSNPRLEHIDKIIEFINKGK